MAWSSGADGREGRPAPPVDWPGRAMSFLSVVIATYNRAEVLRVTLEHLRDQTLPRDRYEAIVVDDGSTDGTGPMLDGWATGDGPPLRPFREEHRGPGHAQNRGIREARGP